MNKKAVFFLQNAWSPVYAGGTWPRHSWLRALDSSRSGQRLFTLINELKNINAWFDNTTPIVGPSPNSKIAPDITHIKEVLNTQKPDYVVACGKQAECVLTFLQINPLLIIPHPAFRLLKNETYIKAANILNQGFTGIVKV